MSATAATASAETKGATSAASNGKTEPKKTEPKKRVQKPKPSFDVAHVEYIILSPALDTRDKGTVRKGKGGSSSSGMARTERFVDSRVYRTGADKMTIQTPQGEEIVFNIAAMEQMISACKDLQVTKEIPNFV